MIESGPIDTDLNVQVSERLSRRRKAKGSSIIISSQRVMMFETSTTQSVGPISTSIQSHSLYKNYKEETNHEYDSSNVGDEVLKHDVIQRPKISSRIKSNHAAHVAANSIHAVAPIQPVFVLNHGNFSASIIQGWWKRRIALSKEELDVPPPPISTPRSEQRLAAKRIISWYRQKLYQRHYVRFTQNRRWSIKLSNRIFAHFLGARVRRILGCDKAKSLMMITLDLKNVITDVLSTNNISDDFCVDDAALRRIERISVGVSSADMTLIKGLIKQYFQSKTAFHDFIFKGSIWREYPYPGYLDISAAVRRRLQQQETRKSPLAIKSLKPMLKRSGIRASVANDLLNSSLQINSLDESTLDIIDYKAPLSRRMSTSAVASNQSFHQLPQPSSSSKRSGPKAHIQLDILSADRLMPAKKGSASRDAYGEIVPDRKPCIKVALYLPNAPSTGSYGGSSEKVGLKRTHQSQRDYDVTTLNPRWGDTLYLPLLCPKSIISSCSSYEEQCEELLKYWSGGSISIQIVDGERFNEEIFLGEVTLLLSFLMVPTSAKRGQDRKKHSLEVHGSYSLNKSQATDRVSGSILLHAYIHLPSQQSLSELMFPKQSIVRGRDFSIGEEWASSESSRRNSKISYDIGSGGRLSGRSQSIATQSSPNIHQYFAKSSTKPSRLYSPDAASASVISPISASSRFRGNGSSSLASPTNATNQTKRMSMIADLSKCLSSLSDLQYSADMAINKMNMKLEAKRQGFDQRKNSINFPSAGKLFKPMEDSINNATYKVRKNEESYDPDLDPSPPGTRTPSNPPSDSSRTSSPSVDDDDERNASFYSALDILYETAHVMSSPHKPSGTEKRETFKSTPISSLHTLSETIENYDNVLQGKSDSDIESEEVYETEMTTEGEVSWSGISENKLPFRKGEHYEQSHSLLYPSSNNMMSPIRKADDLDEFSEDDEEVSAFDHQDVDFVGVYGDNDEMNIYEYDGYEYVPEPLPMNLGNSKAMKTSKDERNDGYLKASLFTDKNDEKVATRSKIVDSMNPSHQSRNPVFGRQDFSKEKDNSKDKRFHGNHYDLQDIEDDDEIVIIKNPINMRQYV